MREHSLITIAPIPLTLLVSRKGEIGELGGRGRGWGAAEHFPMNFNSFVKFDAEKKEVVYD